MSIRGALGASIATIAALVVGAKSALISTPIIKPHISGGRIVHSRGGYYPGVLKNSITQPGQPTRRRK
jgi:hypothetical protein